MDDLSENIQKSDIVTIKTFKNNGCLNEYCCVEHNKSDYKKLVTIGKLFAQKGSTVIIMPRIHIKDVLYQIIFKKLLNTPYERKCPDFLIDGLFYEYEGFQKPWNKRKIKNMLTHGMLQCSRIIIDNTKGCSDRHIRFIIQQKLKYNNRALDEVWIYEKGNIRPFYINQTFIKSNRKA